jgi:hypothetical protein
MALFGGLFKGKETDPTAPAVARIAYAVQTRLGMHLIPPPTEVRALLGRITGRDLLQFDNMQSVAGMQELFHAHGLRALADAPTQTVTLDLAPTVENDEAAPVEQPVRRVVAVGEHRATVRLSAPQAPAAPIAAAAKPAAPAVPLPAELAHLEQLEQILIQMVDLFVRHGQLTSGDKDVLRRLLPADNSPAARIAAVERWQGEITRRVRGMTVPRAASSLLLGGTEAQLGEKPEAVLARRLETLVAWLGKLIKAFEHTGVRFHNKPV